MAAGCGSLKSNLTVFVPTPEKPRVFADGARCYSLVPFVGDLRFAFVSISDGTAFYSLPGPWGKGDVLSLQSNCDEVGALINGKDLRMKFSRLAGAFFTWCGVATFALLNSMSASGQTGTPPAFSHSQTRHAQTGAIAEQRTARALENVQTNPLELHAFLVDMPKGADLHVHLSGAIYAESWIRAGAEDQLCVNTATLSFAKPQRASENAPARAACDDGNVPAAQALKDQHLYDALIDAFSMRGYVPTPGVTGHDQFFDTFDRFGGVDHRHHGEWLDEVATRAAAQNEQYVELMETPDFSHTAALAHELGWREDFGQMRDALRARGLQKDINAAKAAFDEAEAVRSKRERCGQPDETPACHVELRFIYQVLRGFPKEQVFAQTLLGFETAAVDPRIVGLNFVMPEDGYISMTDYALQMRFVGFLHTLYPKVHISLHAGELAPGLVTEEGLCCHIRLAVEQGDAERIGHGVDVMYEDRPYELLKEMAAKGVMVEIALTSNDVILGVSGKDHPFPIYRKFGVPVALATDDEGVSRINLTHEFVRAVQTYGLRYEQIKSMVRSSLEHSFLPGGSLWSDGDKFGRRVTACGKETLASDRASESCAAFLQGSEKAAQQWELERRFRVFEASH
jgi:adenosine deaminase